MTPHKAAVPPAGSASPSFGHQIAQFGNAVVAIATVEAIKLRNDPTELITRAVQPALWLLVFGQVMARGRIVSTGDMPYLDFLAPGILAQSVLFVAIFYGIAIIWERDLGIVHKLLAAPVPRGALVFGKAISAGVRALSQAIIILILSALMGVRLNLHPAAMGGLIAAVIIGASLFATLSLIIACLVKTRERFMGIGQILTMPLFFASNAIYPVSLMPGWLQVVARINPLSYEVDALRHLMLAGTVSSFGLGTDFTVLIGTTLLLTVIAARLYPEVVV